MSGLCGADRISVTWELPIWTGEDPKRQLLEFFTCSWSKVIKMLMPCKSTLVGPGSTPLKGREWNCVYCENLGHHKSLTSTYPSKQHLPTSSHLVRWYPPPLRVTADTSQWAPWVASDDILVGEAIVAPGPCRSSRCDSGVRRRTGAAFRLVDPGWTQWQTTCFWTWLNTILLFHAFSWDILLKFVWFCFNLKSTLRTPPKKWGLVAVSWPPYPTWITALCMV